MKRENFYYLVLYFRIFIRKLIIIKYFINNFFSTRSKENLQKGTLNNISTNYFMKYCAIVSDCPFRKL